MPFLGNRKKEWDREYYRKHATERKLQIALRRKSDKLKVKIIKPEHPDMTVEAYEE